MSERQTRWRLVLGEDGDELDAPLSAEQKNKDRVLEALYGESKLTGGGKTRDRTSPRVARWLGDIRRYFPRSVVSVMQKDAIDRLGIEELLLEPELLEAMTPDIGLVSTLLQLKDVMPAEVKATARSVIAEVVAAILVRIREPTRQAVSGSIDRATKNRRPRASEIDWHRTILRNLKSYQPQSGGLIIDRLVGFGRRRRSLDDVILCVDQSGSMSSSVVYASIFAGVLASLPSLSTQLVVFDTEVVDLSAELRGDPVDLLFGLQLGGGTDIARAVGYCIGRVTRPERTTLVLISDLYEGGNEKQLLKRVAALARAGVRIIVLLALDDAGAPSHDASIAAKLSALSIPCFACTPDLFPELMSAALRGRDIATWAAREGIVTTRAEV